MPVEVLVGIGIAGLGTQVIGGISSGISKKKQLEAQQKAAMQSAEIAMEDAEAVRLRAAEEAEIFGGAYEVERIPEEERRKFTAEDVERTHGLGGMALELQERGWGKPGKHKLKITGTAEHYVPGTDVRLMGGQVGKIQSKGMVMMAAGGLKIQEGTPLMLMQDITTRAEAQRRRILEEGERLGRRFELEAHLSRTTSQIYQQAAGAVPLQTALSTTESLLTGGYSIFSGLSASTRRRTNYGYGGGGGGGGSYFTF